MRRAAASAARFALFPKLVAGVLHRLAHFASCLAEAGIEPAARALISACLRPRHAAHTRDEAYIVIEDSRSPVIG